jgi:hypothetical protein
VRRREFREAMDRVDEGQRLHRIELELHRADFNAMREEQRRRFDAIDAAIENDRAVTREMVIELREGRAMLRDIRHGIKANTEGLLRVLDEFRRGEGPAGAGA